MRVLENLEQGTDEWHELRKRRIGGTRLGDIWSARAYNKKELRDAIQESGIPVPSTATKAEMEELLKTEDLDDVRIELLKNSPRKKGFYELVAEHLGLDRDDEDRMERGHRLETEAREKFEKLYRLKVTEVGICFSDADDRIYNSPDGLIRQSPKSDIFDRALEIKCLSPATHLQAVIENKIPDEYWSQMNQYFVVNENLKTLYWVFYDPSIPSKDFHVIEVSREELEDWPQRLLEFQIAQLQRIDEIVEQLAF